MNTEFHTTFISKFTRQGIGLRFFYAKIKIEKTSFLSLQVVDVQKNKNFRKLLKRATKFSIEVVAKNAFFLKFFLNIL